MQNKEGGARKNSTPNGSSYAKQREKRMKQNLLKKQPSSTQIDNSDVMSHNNVSRTDNITKEKDTTGNDNIGYVLDDQDKAFKKVATRYGGVRLEQSLREIDALVFGGHIESMNEVEKPRTAVSGKRNPNLD